MLSCQLEPNKYFIWIAFILNIIYVSIRLSDQQQHSLILSSCILGMSRPFFNLLQKTIIKNWFPPQERVKAHFFINIFSYLSYIIASLIILTVDPLNREYY